MLSTGGTGGANGSFGTSGEGGSGGNGRISLDDVDGVITGGGTITPSAQVNSIASLIARDAANTTLTSEISCAAREKFAWSDLLAFLIGLSLLGIMKIRNLLDNSIIDIYLIDNFFHIYNFRLYFAIQT